MVQAWKNIKDFPPDSSQTTNVFHWTNNVTTGMDSQNPAPNQSQIGGSHYRKLAIQPWDYVIANELDYFQGSIIKYVTRWRDKNGTEDLRKAKHFLDKYIETMEKK